MRNYIDILNDIYEGLKSNDLIYELKALRNEAENHFTATEIVGKTYSVLLKMNQNPSVNKIIGQLIFEYGEYARYNGILAKPSEFFSLKQKEFIIDGKDFSNLKEFYNCIGEQIVENNDWGKNWNAFNDILRGGFVKIEYGEPFILVWKNSGISESQLEDFNDIIDLIKEHKQINLRLK